MHIVVLCGGYGTRLGELSATRPKYLVPVLGRPFADWQIELLEAQGFTRYLFLVGHMGDQIRAHIEYHHRDLHATFVEDRNLTGPWEAHADLGITERHAVIYGDSYLPFRAEQIKTLYELPCDVRLAWDGEDYGIRFLGGETEPWHEVGSLKGIRELEEFLS